MKILIIGFLVFFGWSSFATYIYVCKIKGLCEEVVSNQYGVVEHYNATAGKTLNKNLSGEQKEVPKNLTVYFEFDKSQLDSDTGTDKYFEESNNFLAQNSQAKISITGYTDAIGTIEYNLALGYRRAQSIQNYFESKGMPANKIIIESKGEKEPIDDNISSVGRAANRRSVLTIKK